MTACFTDSHLEYGNFLNTDISQGSVVTELRYDGIVNDDFVANLLMNLPLKEFWKSVNIWQSYGQYYSGLFFYWLTVYILFSWIIVAVSKLCAFQLLQLATIHRWWCSETVNHTADASALSCLPNHPQEHRRKALWGYPDVSRSHSRSVCWWSDIVAHWDTLVGAVTCWSVLIVSIM